MKQIFNYSLSIIFFSVFIIACSKDRITPVIKPENKPVETLVFETSTDNMLDDLESKPTKKMITKTDDLPFIGSKGTKVWAYENDFIFPDGRPATYPLEIEILELLTPKDMILQQMPTVSNGQILASDGEVRVRVFKDGQELILRRFNSLEIQIPSLNADVDMKLFYGNESSDGKVNWILANDSSQNRERPFSILPGKQEYRIFPETIGWINCDKFYNDARPKTVITLVSELPPINSILSFLYLPEINSVIQVYGDKSLNIPVGMKAKLICISKTTKGEMYTYIKEFTVENNQVINIKVESSTEETLLGYLTLLKL